MRSRNRPTIASNSPQLAPVLRVTRQGYCQPAHSPHGCPVVFVSRPTNDAHLIVLSVNAVWPGEAMRAKLLEEEVKKSCHSFSTPRISSSIEARGVDDTAKILDFYCTAGTLARN